MPIQVSDTDVSAVRVGGEWVDVESVVVDFAEFTSAPGSVAARGLYLSATISTGPNHGERLVAPLRAVEALRA